MTTIESIYLPADCWSEVLSFIPTRERIHVAPTSKEIYKNICFSFTEQTIDLEYCRNITDAGLAHLENVETIDLGGCYNITDAGLAHLSSVKKINLSFCEGVTDAGLAHLRNVENIDLGCCKNITDAGLAHLKNVKEIHLSYCPGITDAGKQMLRERGVNVWRRPRGGRFIHFGNGTYDLESSIFIDTTPNI